MTMAMTMTMRRLVLVGLAAAPFRMAEVSSLLSPCRLLRPQLIPASWEHPPGGGWAVLRRSSSSSSGRLLVLRGVSATAPPSPPSSALVAALETFSVATVVSDIDGTLLNSTSELAPRTAAAIRALRSSGVLFIPATGKCRAGALAALGDLGDELRQGPGVYTNGLQVFGPGGDLLWEGCLERSTIARVERIAEEEQLAVVAYSGDELLCRERGPRTDQLHTLYKEPLPQEVASLADAGSVNKLLLLGEPAVLTSLRPQLESSLVDECAITQAMPHMLEILPPHSSKGAGFLRLAEALAVDLGATIGVGDAENDLSMLEHVGLSVAMGNAITQVQAAANVTTLTNDDAGAALLFETALALSVTRR
uniref:Uncharacterized protein n=1 Tax=Rhizochromulina marina TaxID=1034831 RepID=A0A7S2R5K3_9STRA